MTVKRVLLLLLCLCLLFSPACALELPADTEGQRVLAAYLARVNQDLAELGQMPVNSVFECYPGLAELGVTAADQSDTPEAVTLSFTLYNDCLNKLVLRCSDPGRFPAYAAACVHAASPEAVSLTEAAAEPSRAVSRASASPATSFEEPVSELNGDRGRAYYAYEPNPYHDGVNWLQLTLVFAAAGSPEAGVYTVNSEEAARTEDEHEGYLPVDDYSHYEIFSTATPEPDSPAVSPW